MRGISFPGAGVAGQGHSVRVIPARYMASTPLNLDRRIKGSLPPKIGELYGRTDMDATSNFGSAKILCVERDVAVLDARCAVLKYAGYNTASASPKVAEVLLRSQKFDLIVLSIRSEFDLHRINNLADGADLLVLDGFTSQSELPSLVAQRLDRRQRRA
jgi:CheY-like chemotaxis protein